MLICICATGGLHGLAPRTVPIERWPVPFGRADLGVWQRSAATAQAKRSAVFVRGLSAEARAVLASVGVSVPDAQWRLAYLDPAALATLTLAGESLQLRLAPSHVPQGHARLHAVVPPQQAVGDDADKPFASATARGVLVGLIDTGIDLTHAAFQDAAGRTRVVAVWDQDAPLPSGSRQLATGHYVPGAFGYGHACDARAIDLGTCTFGDPLGHGTHVASIAAGSAASAHGVAPEADIALVRSEHFTQLADAVAYLDGLAQSRGQPLVINISVGGHYGPHDGRTPLETYLNHMAQAGRIIVAAAGNDGQSTLHVGLELASAPTRVVLEDVPDEPGTQAELDFWLPKDARVSWALELWEEGIVTAELVLDAPLGSMGRAPLVDQANKLIAHVTMIQEIAPEHDMQHLGLQFAGANALPRRFAGRWVLRFRGAGALQGWVGQAHVGASSLHFGVTNEAGFVSGDNQRSITVPATAPRLITVGSYTVQNAWMAQIGGLQSLQRAVIGAHSDFSSLGPTGFPLSTGFKPDVCAPGSMVVAARSKSVPDGPNTLDGSQMVMQGTSMAAPHVTGAIALMLAADNSLEPQDVRRLLHQTARRDGFTQATPNAAWGFGKLDTAAALAATQDAGAGCAAAQSTVGAWFLSLGTLYGRLKSRRQGLGDALRKWRS